jgi:mRNA interferase HigB
LQTWYADVKHATWTGPADIKSAYHNARFLANNRVVFNIKGNRYRIIVVVQYRYELVYIRFVGTHKEYDRISVETI